MSLLSCRWPHKQLKATPGRPASTKALYVPRGGFPVPFLKAALTQPGLSLNSSAPFPLSQQHQAGDNEGFNLLSRSQ